MVKKMNSIMNQFVKDVKMDIEKIKIYNMKINLFNKPVKINKVIIV